MSPTYSPKDTTILFVGMTRFERAIFCSQSRRITKFSYIPLTFRQPTFPAENTRGE